MFKAFITYIVLISTFIFSGCSNRKELSIPTVKKVNVKYPLYMEYNIKKDDFNTTIFNKLNKKISVRMDNFNIVDTNSSSFYKEGYLKRLIWHNEFNCDKTRLGTEQVPISDIGTAMSVDLLLGAISFGIYPIAMGIPYGAGYCKIDKTKLQNYSKIYMYKHIPNRRKILDIYNLDYELALNLDKQQTKIMTNLSCNNKNPNININKLNFYFPCTINSCENKLNKLKQTFEQYNTYQNKILKIKKYDVYNLYHLYNNNQIYYLNDCLKNSYKNKLSYINKLSIEKINKIIKNHPKDKKINYEIEKNLVNKLINNGKIVQLKKFVKLFPKSRYLTKVKDKIAKIKFDIKRKNVMNEIRRNMFYNKWDSLYWDGKYDKDGWPTGKGVFYITENLSQGGFLGMGRVTGEINVEVRFKNHKITTGKASAYLKQHKLFGMYNRTEYTYSNKFNGVKKMNDAIIDSLNSAIREWNGKVIQKRSAQGSKCDIIYKQCMSYCDKKSSKGFFNDKSSCQNSCISGKVSCENGEYSLGKITSCRGICKGVDASNGSFLGWGASSFDKCVNSCTERIGR